MVNKPRFARITAAALVLTLLLPTAALADDSTSRDFDVKIVHTNDIHARVEENADSGIIGAARLAGVIQTYTDGADLDLVLDSGDLFHGQPIATLVQGESVAELIRACGYDAVTAGNHDWSYGKDRLKERCQIADVAMLTGNVVDADTGDAFFDDAFYTESVQIGGQELKVGVFGVIDPSIKGSTTPKNVAGLDFTDAAAYANQAADALRAQGCDVVIGLTHTYDPAGLAEKVGGVDLWLAGHEHVQLDKTVTDADGEPTRVVESGYYLYSLSLIELSGTLDETGAVENLEIDVTPMDYAGAAAYPASTAVNAVLDDIHDAQQDKLAEKVGETPETLDGVWEHLRIDQQNLGNVVCDAYLLETGADVAFENAGGIRASVEAGDVTYGDIIGVSPYGNYVVTKQVTGAALKEIMETSLDIGLQSAAADESGDYNAWPENSGSYLQFGGMTVTWDPAAAKGSRVTAIEVQGVPLEAEQTYTIATNNYVAVSDNYPQLAQAAEAGQFTACDEVLVRFFQQDADTIAASVYDERLRTVSDEADCPSAAFTDVQPTDWFHEAVDFVVENGLMNGTEATVFEPETAVSRGMAATVLWRLAGSPVVNYAMRFDDVAPDAYYTEAIRWAASEHIVDGHTETCFAPETPVSREQLAAMLYRFAQQQGQDVSIGEDTNILSYTDFDQLSEYAIPAMQWACGAGVIQGSDDGLLQPQGTASRAETAQMLLRYMEPAA